MLKKFYKLLQALSENEQAQMDLTRLFMNGGGAVLVDTAEPDKVAS